jgi:DivIVA domain-containing protein
MENGNEKIAAKRFRKSIRGYDKTEVDQYVRVLHDTVKKLEEMYIEKAAAEKKRPQILSLNAACDSVPDNVRGTDMLIIRFDSGIEDHYVYLGQIAGMVFSDEVRFSVAVCVGSEPPDDILLKCFDKVISVSSEIEEFFYNLSNVKGCISVASTLPSSLKSVSLLKEIRALRNLFCR